MQLDASAFRMLLETLLTCGRDASTLNIAAELTCKVSATA